MYSKFLTFKNSALIKGTSAIQEKSKTIKRIVQNVGCNKLAKIIRINKIGIPLHISISLCPNKSTLPPKYPQIAPTKNPMIELKKVKIIAKRIEVCKP